MSKTKLQEKFGDCKKFRVIGNSHPHHYWRIGTKVKLIPNETARTSGAFRFKRKTNTSTGDKKQSLSLNDIEPWVKEWKPKRGELVEVLPSDASEWIVAYFIDDVSDLPKGKENTGGVYLAINDGLTKRYKEIRKIAKKQSYQIGDAKFLLTASQIESLQNQANELEDE